MAEKYINDEQILKAFANMLNDTLFESLTEVFLQQPVLLYDDSGNIDMATAFMSDYFQRSAEGEFADVEQYLTELCIHIEDSGLRDKLIEQFDLDSEYIESEL